MYRPLDDTDLMILKLLQEDGRLKVKQIALKVHKSASPVHDRIKKLQELGYIKRYTAVLDREKIGHLLLVVALVTLSKHTQEAVEGFETSVRAMPKVFLCLSLSGPIDFLLHVASEDTRAYRAFLSNELCRLPYVERVDTCFVLGESKGDVVYPL